MTLSEQSLRTRLANVGYSQKETAQTLNIGPLNSEMEVTLSGSVVSFDHRFLLHIVKCTLIYFVLRHRVDGLKSSRMLL